MSWLWSSGSRCRAVQIRPLRDWNILRSLASINDPLEFKSDRCGIEMECEDNLNILDDACSNQTVAGLKYITTSCFSIYQRGSNQTVAGLKWGCRGAHQTDSTGSNQTVAGLKYRFRMIRQDARCCVQIRPLRDWNSGCGADFRWHFWGSNQTVAGLKWWLSNWNNRCCTVQIRPLRDWNADAIPVSNTAIMFKSDRCGIEIWLKVSTSSWLTSFKSDRCGIEILHTQD